MTEDATMALRIKKKARLKRAFEFLSWSTDPESDQAVLL
jgi:hypothetical protein